MGRLHPLPIDINGTAAGAKRGESISSEKAHQLLQLLVHMRKFQDEIKTDLNAMRVDIKRTVRAAGRQGEEGAELSGYSGPAMRGNRRTSVMPL